MSLWSKNPAEITFADVDAFCQSNQSEGVRLDYKGIAFPSDLAKSLAAFANTLGGLIILGVDADPTTNTPIWPPKQGMPTAKGLEERVYQIAREAVYPPVRVAVSPAIDNERLPGHSILVIRVDESPAAPHALDKKRRVLIYERDANQSTSYDLADIERIEHLLRRRDALVGKREAEIAIARERGNRHLTNSFAPVRWAAVGPMFPWRDLCTTHACWRYHRIPPFGLFYNAHYSYQQAPGGSLALGRLQLHDDDKRMLGVCMTTMNASGLVFGIAYPRETLIENKTLLSPKGLAFENVNDISISFTRTREMAQSIFRAAKLFYEANVSEKPGTLIASIGILRALDLTMYSDDDVRVIRAKFPDGEFRADVQVDMFEFMKDHEKATQPLFDQMAAAFDLG